MIHTNRVRRIRDDNVKFVFMLLHEFKPVSNVQIEFRTGETATHSWQVLLRHFHYHLHPNTAPTLPSTLKYCTNTTIYIKILYYEHYHLYPNTMQSMSSTSPLPVHPLSLTEYILYNYIDHIKS